MLKNTTRIVVSLSGLVILLTALTVLYTMLFAQPDLADLYIGRTKPNTVMLAYFIIMVPAGIYFIIAGMKLLFPKGQTQIDPYPAIANLLLAPICAVFILSSQELLPPKPLNEKITRAIEVYSIGAATIGGLNSTLQETTSTSESADYRKKTEAERSAMIAAFKRKSTEIDKLLNHVQFRYGSKFDKNATAFIAWKKANEPALITEKMSDLTPEYDDWEKELNGHIQRLNAYLEPEKTT